MSPLVYFCGSIYGGRQDAQLYNSIINELKKKYGKVVNEYVGNVNISSDEPYDAAAVYNGYVDMIKQSDVIVAEVTQPSLGVGFEIGLAISMQKNIICLFRPERGIHLSCMIEGANNGGSFIVKHYTGDEYIAILKDYFARFYP